MQSSRHAHTILLSFIVLSSVILLTNCNGGKYTIIKGGIQATNHSMNGSYSDFSGNYYRRIRLNKKKNLYVNFFSHTQNGSLKLELIDEQGNVLFATKRNDLEHHEIHILSTGDYKIEVIGKNHKGSFNVTWHSS